MVIRRISHPSHFTVYLMCPLVFYTRHTQYPLCTQDSNIHKNETETELNSKRQNIRNIAKFNRQSNNNIHRKATKTKKKEDKTKTNNNKSKNTKSNNKKCGSKIQRGRGAVAQEKQRCCPQSVPSFNQMLGQNVENKWRISRDTTIKRRVTASHWCF